jgi:hypothetical protein
MRFQGGAGCPVPEDGEPVPGNSAEPVPEGGEVAVAGRAGEVSPVTAVDAR